MNLDNEIIKAQSVEIITAKSNNSSRICHNEICVLTDCVLITACSASTTGMSKLKMNL
jgi:hypothetical protein